MENYLEKNKILLILEIIYSEIIYKQVSVSDQFMYIQQRLK